MAHVAFHHKFAGKRIRIASAAVLALGVLSIPCTALAQDSAGSAGTAGTAVSSKKVTLNLENADLRYALKLLFNSVGVSYTLDQAATGVVTVSLTDVPFRTALESILRAAGGGNKLTYRVEDNVYNVTLKQETAQITSGSSDPDPEPAAKKSNERIVKIALNYADAQAIAQAFGGGIISSQFGASVMGGFGGGFGQGGMNQGGMGSMGGFGNGGGFGNNNSFGNGSFGSGFGNGMNGGGFNGGGMNGGGMNGGGFPGGNNRGGGGGGAPGGGARR